MKHVRFISQSFILHDIDITPTSWFDHIDNIIVIKSGRRGSITLPGLLIIAMVERFAARKNNGILSQYEICEPEVNL